MGVFNTQRFDIVYYVLNKCNKITMTRRVFIRTMQKWGTKQKLRFNVQLDFEPMRIVVGGATHRNKDIN